MRKKRLKYCISAALIFVLLATAAIYAASMYRLSYVEKFETGKVDIYIQEISAVEEGEEPGSQPLAEANKDLSYVPQIINRAADCYVRAKVEIIMDGECERPLSLDDVYGLNGDWICRGDYFYYTKTLLEGEQVNLFEGLHIPEDWEYGDSNGFDVDVKAEAVQSANFMPDFNSELPWGAVELKTVASASGNECVEAVPVSAVSEVEYDSAGGFQCDTSDLFDEFEGMMPGGCCEKTVKLKNSAKTTLSASLEITAEDSEFNNKLKLKIFSDDVEVFDGTVAEASCAEGLSITDIPKGKTGNITFQVSLPADADNSYAENREVAVWDINVEEVPDDSVQTGDYSMLVPYVVIAAFALLLMMCAAFNKRKENDETNN